MKVIGMNNVGVIQREDGLYVCYNSKKYEWFLSPNINDAETILGDKEFNFMRLKELYQNSDIKTFGSPSKKYSSDFDTNDSAIRSQEYHGRHDNG